MVRTDGTVKWSVKKAFVFQHFLIIPPAAGKPARHDFPLTYDKSTEATTPHGPATWLASCVLAVARRFECSEVARTAYGACASDRRSVGAWTERAPNLRGREGVNTHPTYLQTNKQIPKPSYCRTKRWRGTRRTYHPIGTAFHRSYHTWWNSRSVALQPTV